MTCECLGCTAIASRNIVGRLICEPCYSRNEHLYFEWPDPLPPFTFIDRHPWVRDGIIALAFMAFLFATLALLPEMDCETLKGCLFISD